MTNVYTCNNNMHMFRHELGMWDNDNMHDNMKTLVYITMLYLLYQPVNSVAVASINQFSTTVSAYNLALHQVKDTT